jgi:uncharacterized membrane protein
MTRRGHLWAIGFEDMGRALVVRNRLVKLAREEHDLILLDVALAVRYRDGLLTLNGEPFLASNEIHRGTISYLLAGLALGAPPMTASAVKVALDSVGVTPSDVGISDTFVCEVACLVKPGTSALFVLDEVGNLDPVLHGIEGLGGTVLKTNVDLERARLIQSALSTFAEGSPSP